MRTVSRWVLNSALMVSSMTGFGCAALSSPRLNAQRRSERCEIKLSTARLEENRGNLDAAKRQYTEVHQQYPQNAECLHRLAIIYTEQKRLDEAEAYYRQSYALDPNNSQLLADMGYAAFLKKDYERAEMFLEKSVKLNGSDQVAIKNLAITRAWMQKDADSLASFRMIYGEAESIRRLAEVQEARGDHERSQKNQELADRLESPRANAPLLTVQNPSVPSPQLPVEIPPTVQETSFQASADNDPLVSIKIPVLTVPQGSKCSPPGQTKFEEQPVDLLEATFVADISPVVNLPQPRVSIPPAPCAVSQSVVSSPVVDSIGSSVEVSVSVVSKDSVIAVEYESRPLPAPPQIAGPSHESNATWDQPVVAADLSLPPASEPKQDVSSPQQSVWRKVASVDNPFPDSNRIASQMNPGATNPLQATAGLMQVEDQPALQGICLVTLFEERRIIPSSPEFFAVHQSQKYSFSSAEAREKFLKDPLRYVPVAGGLDIVSVRNAKLVEQGSIKFAVWYKRQLYLFTCAEHAETFRREPHLYVNAN